MNCTTNRLTKGSKISKKKETKETEDTSKLIRCKGRIPGIHQKDDGFFVNITIYFFPPGTTDPGGPGPVHYRGFTMTLKTRTR
jgi:hypothetical protein